LEFKALQYLACYLFGLDNYANNIFFIVIPGDIGPFKPTIVVPAVCEFAGLYLTAFAQEAGFEYFLQVAAHIVEQFINCLPYYGPFLKFKFGNPLVGNMHQFELGIDKSRGLR